MKKTGADRFLIWRDGDFRHYGQKDHDGHIVFWETGSVTVQWNRAAAIASAHGSGNRRVKATIATGKRTPPDLHPLFEQIETCRFFAEMRKGVGDPLPVDPFDDRVPHLLGSSFRDIAWKMVSAVLQLNADSLREIADTVERVKDVESTPTDSKWVNIAKAVEAAAMKAQSIPTRQQVEEQLQEKHPNLCKDLTGDLGRMGLGWLAQPPGRPPKKHGMKRGLLRP